MQNDPSFTSYVRAYLLSVRKYGDPRSVDEFVQSGEFSDLALAVKKEISASMLTFLTNTAATVPEFEPGIVATGEPRRKSASVVIRDDSLKPMDFPPLAPSAPPVRNDRSDHIELPSLEMENGHTTGQHNPVASTPLDDASAEGKKRVANDTDQPSAAATPSIADMADMADMADTPPAPALPSVSGQSDGPSASSDAASDLVMPSRSPIPAPVLKDISLQLPNARVGVFFDHVITSADPQSDAVITTEIIIPPGMQLTATVADARVTGTPEQAGEFDLSVLYHFAGEPASRRREALVKIVVNPDPKTLWKQIPSDRSDKFWREDAAQESVYGGDLSLLAASQRGRSHAHVGGFRDDDFRITRLQDTGWNIAVVSDGAGSAKFSRRGAQLICETSLEHLSSTLSGKEGVDIDAAAHAFHKARSEHQAPERIELAHNNLHNAIYVTVGHAAYYAVKAIANEVANQVAGMGGATAVAKDFSSTALIGACKRYAFGTLCMAYWVGDGAVGVYSSTAGVALLGEVDSGEFSGQTRFLEPGEVTQEAIMKRTRFDLVDSMTAMVLMTDGVSDAKFETEARLSRTADWQALWEDLDRSVHFAERDTLQSERLLAWLDFWSQGNHDDRTIAIIF